MKTFRHGDFDAAGLVAARRGRTVAVCLPARDEERTVGTIVSCVRARLTARGGGAGLVDEIVVIDDASTDDTASVARRAGARVVHTTPETAAKDSRTGGKGEAMRLALAETHSDVLVFLDADVENFGPHFVTGLLGPLLGDGEQVSLVKAFYDRPLDGSPTGGGRVTELTARPVIDLLFPHLRAVRQPLAGESAAPRAVLEATGIAAGYGAELGLLIDVAARYGAESIAQVDLGVRIHRNRPLDELRHQATDVLRVALARAGVGSPS